MPVLSGPVSSAPNDETLPIGDRSRMPSLSEEEKARRATTRRRKAAIAAEENAIRRENKQREWHEKGTYLSRAELDAGVHCRGCGLPIIDDLGKRPPLLKMTDEERAEHEAAEADFKRRHPDCHASRWSMSGSRTTHCSFCCPPPPLSDKQIQAIRAILASTSSPNPTDLDTWRLTLTCDHTIDKTQHSSNTYWSAATVTCPTCDQTRGVISSDMLPPNAARLTAERHRLTVKLDQARAEYEHRQKKTDTARRLVEELEAELLALDGTADQVPS